MSARRTYRIPQYLIHWFIWVMAFTIPLLLNYENGIIQAHKLLHAWVTLLPFLIAYIINSKKLFPYLNKRKYKQYLLYSGILVIIISIFGNLPYLLGRIIDNQVTPQPAFPAGTPPPHPTPPGGQFMQEAVGERGSAGQEAMGEQIPAKHFFNLHRIFFNFAGTILVMGLNNAIKITTRWIEARKHYDILQKEKLKTELAFLKHQISPHFFMNTLNNIHALIDYDSETAKKSVIRLSKLMRTLLYDSESDNFSLAQEIAFLRDYIDLMKIRVRDDVDIRFEYPEIIPDKSLPPLLCISYVENAFKHGIIPSSRSHIYIRMSVNNNRLDFVVKNSYQPESFREERVKNSSNIGMQNASKRLDLIFGKEYHLKVNKTAKEYVLHLNIPLS